jgi:hypothetical protein
MDKVYVPPLLPTDLQENITAKLNKAGANKTPTLGTLALLGVPGCWAEDYRSRAREWSSK